MEPLYSLVIPVFNSGRIVGDTIDRVVEVFTAAGLRFELVLVNDGSSDDSWQVISSRARTTPHVLAINLLKNYGQHHANLAGFRATTGDWVITLDDDLQNPPEEALKLIQAAQDGGHDVVFGQFETKQAAGYRRLGSKMINLINRRVFGQPTDLAVSNFRILHRDVVDRICNDNNAYPYVTGQALIYSNDPGNVLVRHDPRPVGSSNYSLLRIVRLLLTILFSYSLFPLRLAAGVGFAVSALAFLLGGGYLVRGFITDSRAPGWTSLVVLLAVFNGFLIALVSMLGEYVLRTLNAVTTQRPYHVVERVSVDEAGGRGGHR
ncbi:glycosyltransferase family 2 protein [Nocardioides marmoribigeumensis]|uniref:Glycosyltransferase involved in cell wall biosynthesis n=1 Tax=Nocardioides marmoribigeumensis TaxID=433649 RepID=A0ABU2BSP1_9ACTN|nr:glycosyltransferase family 2 protein [Nocardioides marmoribigeumensis]MDR7361647.1 glycosyltransferase involved in cell wall biosynthesis [Nocardioides marmoribigeumensis]